MSAHLNIHHTSPVVCFFLVKVMIMLFFHPLDLLLVILLQLLHLCTMLRLHLFLSLLLDLQGCLVPLGNSTTFCSTTLAPVQWRKWG